MQQKEWSETSLLEIKELKKKKKKNTYMLVENL
jgi:hypothetical protein